VPEGSGARHVVGHHVDDDAHTQLVGCLREPPESVLPSALFRDPRVVHDVVAVGGLRCRLQDRRAEQVGDAERVQVWQPRRGVVEGEPSVQLHPVGRVRYGPVGLHPLQSTGSLRQHPHRIGSGRPVVVFVAMGRKLHRSPSAGSFTVCNTVYNE